MKSKILITGGAGFIGSELIKYLKNKNSILIVDKKKSKKLVSKYKKLGIKYTIGNLLDLNFSRRIYKNIDTIFHLAGIVKVPNTDIDLNVNKEKKIFNDAIQILNNIVKFSNKNTKIIFPSTHLVFENCKKNKQTFYENSKPLPNLAYSRSKLKCEKLLKKNFKDVGILRLGSVYGLAEDEKRMFNLPNLFPLRASKNLDLKLFSGGVQIKSIVSVKDVVKAMIFLSKKPLNGQIFNLVSEHLTVKEIGEICKKFNQNINLVSTNDKIPYEGYYINCKKIKKAGFNFSEKYFSFAKKLILRN